MTIHSTIEVDARHVLDAVRADGFVIVAGHEPGTMFIGEPEHALALDAHGFDRRMHLIARMRAEPSFRAAVREILETAV
jgi:hypothetical protein